jgi:L-fuculose-phosphate aldolase
MRSMDRSTAADAIVRAGARLGRRGLIAAGEGNLSCRLDDGSILVTPSGYRKDELTADDLLVVSAARAVVGGDRGPRPTSDLAIHRAVYEARPDVGAVAHAHLPASMGITLAGERPDASALPETAALLRRVPFIAFGEMGSVELAGRIAAAFVEGPDVQPVAVLLERHGAVAVGEDPDAAVDRLELVEVLCRAWRDALLVRAARAVLAEAPASRE